MAPAVFDDDDPVTAEYDVFITPELAEQIYLLQYPNRDRERPYNQRSRNKPLEMRVKPNSGFIEMDIPANVSWNFDKRKGIEWGESMRKVKGEGLTAFGLAGGFSPLPSMIGRQARSTSAIGGDEAMDIDTEDPVDQLLSRFNDANDKGHVLNKQTLGGQIMKDEPGKPMYMLGAFHGNELHLTKVTGVVQMRPQFHHIDAQVQLDIANRRREREAGEPTRTMQPRAVEITVRNLGQDDENIEKARRFLQSAQEEKWTTLRYHDEDSGEAYAAYHESLFVAETEKTPKLTSSMNNLQYLDAISAPRTDPSGRVRKKPLTKKQLRAMDDLEDSDDEVVEVVAHDHSLTATHTAGREQQ